MPWFDLLIEEQGRAAYSRRFDGPLELGRQDRLEPAPYALVGAGRSLRLIVAPHLEASIGRRHARLSFDADGALVLTNPSERAALVLGGGETLSPLASRPVNDDTLVPLGTTRTAIIRPGAPEAELRSLPDATIAPGRGPSAPGRGPSAPPGDSVRRAASDPRLLLRAVEATMSGLQTALTADEFFDHAVRGAIELVDLDEARVLLRREEAWVPTGRRTEAPPNPASRRVLGRLLDERRTFWDSGAGAALPSDSLAGVESAIASPILDRDENVVGALYGVRRVGTTGRRPPISDLDATLLELLAGGVAAGLDRLDHQEAARRHEEDARRARVQFEQFFGPHLARELETSPGMLDGRDADVTLLFCDIRGFSLVADRIGAAMTFAWINDVMEALSECVARHQGVLVDYVGDELIAMWGAPRDQPDQHRLACLAALDMRAQLAGLDARWIGKLKEPTEFGVGIHSGRARAGNCGSKHKFKYGPLGPDVNLASRVQGATKYFQSPILVTAETAARLGDEFMLRRLGRVRFVNIKEPVELLELMLGDRAEAATLKTSYEKALDLFVEREFKIASTSAAKLIDRHENDGPSLALLSRSVNALVEGPAEEHPVWVLPGK